MVVGQDLGGGHPTDQHLAGPGDPPHPGLLGRLDHPQLGLQHRQAPLRLLAPPATVSQLAGQHPEVAAVPQPPGDTEAVQPSGQLSLGPD
jgi:hypothetical protein